MDIVHNLLIRFLQVFEISMDLYLLYCLIKEIRKGLYRYRSVRKFHISCLNYVIQTQIKDNLQALVLLLSFL